MWAACGLQECFVQPAVVFRDFPMLKLCFLVYLLVFKSVLLVKQQVPTKRT